MSDNNNTSNSNQPQSGHLAGRAEALAQIAVGLGLRSPEEGQRWALEVVASHPDEGQMHVDNMIAYLQLSVALSE